MELTEENVITVLEELLPYIEADGGSLQLVEIEEETDDGDTRCCWCCAGSLTECWSPHHIRQNYSVCAINISSMGLK